jgi:hypothetical protein
MYYCLWITGNMDSCNATATSSARSWREILHMTIDIYIYGIFQKGASVSITSHVSVDDTSQGTAPRWFSSGCQDTVDPLASSHN